METLHLARAKYLLDQVSNNVKYVTLDGSPALPSEAAELIECLGKLGLVEAADAMRKDFIVYFAHETRLPNTGLDPRLVEFRSKANELFGPFLKYSRPQGDSTVVRLRLIDQFDGLRITFKKLSMLTPPLLPSKQPSKPKGKPGPKAPSPQQIEQWQDSVGGEPVREPEVDSFDQGTYDLQDEGLVLVCGDRVYNQTSSQAAIVKVLFEAWEAGRPTMPQDSIREAVYKSIDGGPAELRAVFRGSGANGKKGSERYALVWREAIEQGERKNTLRLKDPEKLLKSPRATPRVTPR